MVCAVFTALITATTSYAHENVYYDGGYVHYSSSNIILRIAPSAYADTLLSENDFYLAYDWNNVSSKVKLNLLYEAPGMPTSVSMISVVGEILPDGYVGVTRSYGVDGSRLKGDQGLNADWATVIIVMTRDTSQYDDVFSSHLRKTAARATFVHEVGHALKLNHTLWYRENNVDHYIDGYPKAVMHKSVREDQPALAYTVVKHDKDCLIEKWGA